MYLCLRGHVFVSQGYQCCLFLWFWYFILELFPQCGIFCFSFIIWRVWRYQRSNQNPYIEEKQTTQWPKEKVRKNKQRSRNHTYKTKDRVTRTPLKTGGELMCSGRVTSSCSISGTRRIKLVTNLVISREWGKDGEVFTTSVDIYGSLSVASWKTGASHTNKKY